MSSILSTFFFFLSHSFLSSFDPFNFLSFQSKFAQRCYLICGLHFCSPPVAKTPLILTNTCNSRTTDSHCISIPQDPLDTTGPTGYYRTHWTLYAPLDTTGPTGHHRPHWILQDPLDIIRPTGHHRPHWILQDPLDTTGPTGHYTPHWTPQAPLDTTGHTGHYRPH